MSTAPYILALDISGRSTGVAEGRVGEAPKLYSVRFKKEYDSMSEIGARAMRWISERLTLGAPDYFIVERSLPTFTKMRENKDGEMRPTTSVEVVQTLITLHAILRSSARIRNLGAIRTSKVDDYTVSHMTVRAAFIGAGNLKSDVAKQRVGRMCELLGWSPANTDEADAAAVWWWAGTMVDPHRSSIVTPMMHGKVAGQISPGALFGGAG